MPKEEKDAVREKDKLRKRRKAQEKFHFISQEEITKDREEKTPFSRADERETDKQYRRKVRKGMTKAENEYERVYNLLKMRQERQARDGKGHLLDNLKAKQGMRDLREKGRVVGKEFMRRAKRDKDEEVLWWSYWTMGKTFKDVLMKKRPETAAAMKEKEDLLKKKEDERTKIEKELDAKGRWIWENEEYYWSIPDKNGCMKSMAEFEAEEEAEEEAKIAKLSPEEKEEKRKKEEEKRKRDKEMEKKHEEQMAIWYAQEQEEQKKERNRRVREKRKKQKEQLQIPIDMPSVGEKGAYEKARDDIICERHRVMAESGMFTQKELKSIEDKIVIY